MKNLKYLLMVIMMVALAIVVSACKTEDPVQVDEFDRVSATCVVTAQYDGTADTITTFVFRVKTFASTRIEGTTHIGPNERMFGMDVSDTNGQWVEVSKEVPMGLRTGTHDVWGQFTMMSIGKTITSPTTQVTVK